MFVTKEELADCYSFAEDEQSEVIIKQVLELEDLLGLGQDKELRERMLNRYRNNSRKDCESLVATSQCLDRMYKYQDMLQYQIDNISSIYNSCTYSSLIFNEILEKSEAVAEQEKIPSSIPSRGLLERNSCSSSANKLKEKQNRLPNRATSILWSFLKENKGHPYPSTEQKIQLAKETKLTMTQIRNWFTNTRKRKLSQAPENDEDFSPESENEGSYCSSYSPSESQHTHRRRQNKRSCSPYFIGPKKHDNSHQIDGPSGYFPTPSLVSHSSSDRYEMNHPTVINQSSDCGSDKIVEDMWDEYPSNCNLGQSPVVSSDEVPSLIHQQDTNSLISQKEIQIPVFNSFCDNSVYDISQYNLSTELIDYDHFSMNEDGEFFLNNGVSDQICPFKLESVDYPVIVNYLFDD